MLRKICLCGRTICYDLQRKSVKNINLRIKADQSVHVSANVSVSANAVERFLQSKAEYVVRALDRYADLAETKPVPKQYADGELLLIFGCELLLKIFPGKQNSAVIRGSCIELMVTDPGDAALRKKTITQWLDKMSCECITAVCRSVYPEFQKYGMAFPKLRFRKMVSQWGNCQPKNGVLTFNTALVKTPAPCIEYVAVHEFAHFLQPNHS